MTQFDLTLPSIEALKLRISDETERDLRYPSARLQKGLCLLYSDQDLTEEAVGFGVPVLKCGLKAFFPGMVELQLLQGAPAWKVKAVYGLNLVERLARVRSAGVESKVLYSIKDAMADLIRRVRILRGPLTAVSTALRRVFGWDTRYEPAQVGYQVGLVYSLDLVGNCLNIETSQSAAFPAEITELIIMNELGAHAFDQYRDSNGLNLSGKEIGCWDEVRADRASFTSSLHRVGFTLHKTAGARLFRGRELLGSRLAWAGFGCVLTRPFDRFECSLRFEKVE